MKNKKIIMGVGAVALLGVVYYMMKKKKATSNSNVITNNETIAPTKVSVANIPAYTIQWKEDPTKAVFLVVKGEKFGFMSPKAFDAYGRSEPKSVTKSELDAIPTVGFVDETGEEITYASLRDEN